MVARNEQRVRFKGEQRRLSERNIDSLLYEPAIDRYGLTIYNYPIFNIQITKDCLIGIIRQNTLSKREPLTSRNKYCQLGNLLRINQ